MPSVSNRFGEFPPRATRPRPAARARRLQLFEHVDAHRDGAIGAAGDQPGSVGSNGHGLSALGHGKNQGEGWLTVVNGGCFMVVNGG